MHEGVVCFFLITFMGVQFALAETDRSFHSCEPSDFDHIPRFWMNKLNLTSGNRRVNAKFLSKLVYQSSMIQPVPSALAKSFGREAVLTHFYALYGTKQLLPFRVSNYPRVFHFYHGDLAIVHTLNAQTGVYRRNELGGHTLRYTLIVDKDVYYSVDLETHTNKEFVLVGITLVNDNEIPSTYQFGNWDKLLDEFPQHSMIINKLYKRSPDYPKPEK